MLKQTYHLGIIDYLQEYNTKKRMELKMKSLFVNSDDVKGISVADPKFYQERFKRFIYDKVLTR